MTDINRDFFKLDRDKCLKCSQCIHDCAFRALKANAEGYPEIPHPEACMRCQHCFAICPAGAIEFDGRNPADSVEPGAELPSAQAVSNWMRLRRSVRHFTGGDVPREKLERIFRSLANAPTGCNARALTFTCYPNRAAMEKFKLDFINKLETYREGDKILPKWLAVPAIRLRKGLEDVFFRNAPGMVVVSCDETAPGVTTPKEDVIAACTYFEMIAQAEGLATCWCGFLDIVKQAVPSVAQALGLRESTPFYAMLFGESAVRYARGVQRDGYAAVKWQD